ncbi:phosphohydrolase [Candidatus Magnetomorum sp. HK-1]|nr:phosphohydrolase [Candidatus Magnetomorum sp. HK-1]
MKKQLMSDTNNPKLYSNNIIRTYELLVKSKYSYIDFSEVLQYADMSDYNPDTNNNQWFTQQQINRFYQKLVQLTGNEDIGYDAGMYTTSPEAIGKYRTAFLSLGNPLNAYNKVPDISKELTRSSSYSVKRISDSSVRITVTKNPGIKEEPFQCKNRQGIFVGIYHIFDNTREPTIKHNDDECMFKSSGDICEYEISWKLSRSVIWKKFQTICNYAIPSIIVIAFCNNSSKTHCKPDL